jgi:uncharacterized protein YneF (UPF0154 family)
MNHNKMAVIVLMVAIMLAAAVFIGLLVVSKRASKRLISAGNPARSDDDISIKFHSWDFSPSHGFIRIIYSSNITETHDSTECYVGASWRLWGTCSLVKINKLLD